MELLGYRQLCYPFFHHLHKLVHLPKIGPQKPEPGIKNEFEQMKREFPFGTFRPGRQGSLTVYKRISGNSGWKINRARLAALFTKRESSQSEQEYSLYRYSSKRVTLPAW